MLAGWEAEAQLGLKHLNPLYPDDLRIYFKNLARKTRGLKIHVSAWKPALYLKFDREFFAPSKWKRFAGAQVFYSQERAPYAFASCHEKVVLLDDNCCFTGGIDISKDRWDTRAHSLKKTGRRNSDGEGYRPTHDLQAVISGEAAKCLKEFVGPRFPSVSQAVRTKSKSLLWPASVPAQAVNLEVAFSRTEPKKKVFEILRFYLDAIASAKHHIFIENQYFTHPKIVEALVSKLEAEKGPEILLNFPLSYPGFFERAVYGNLRRKALKRLLKADKQGRLKIVHPARSGENKKNFVIVHSKFMAVDNRLLTLGSANLNKRSMKTDREINICLESRPGNECSSFIRSSVAEIIAEHLEATKEEFEKEWEDAKSLIGAIENFSTSPRRTLLPLPLNPLPLRERLFFFISPFVDPGFLLPKARFNLMLAAFFVFFVVAAKAVYDF